MGMIHVLQDDVINKIAAGEVVERPANVLKELIENAIDAEAKHITVELQEGGKKRITIIDDGRGIPKEDVPLAVRRHATSKITDVEDLFSIHSMGFRGEALSSIASVSRFSLSTRNIDEAEGSRLVLHDETEGTVVPWNGKAGTSISVEELFYNVPAREKFLKATATEYSHCLELVKALALSRPDIGFTLIHNGKEQFHAPSVVSDKVEGEFFGEETLRKRAVRVFGDEVTSQLLYACEEDQYGYVEALISPPGVEKATRKNIFCFVNDRWVKDKVIQYGVMRGYHSHLLKGRYPQVVFYLHLDPSLVDVNVHPSKTELRFQYAGEMQSMVAGAIRKRIRMGDWGDQNVSLETNDVFTSTPSVTPSHTDFDLSFSKGGSAPKPVRSSLSTSSYSGSYSPKPASYKIESYDYKGPASKKESDQSSVMTESYGEIKWDELRYMGSFAKCYLFFEWQEELLVIDQHAFHERILFERLTKNKELLKKSQGLMIPESFDFSSEEILSLKERQSELTEMGFNYQIISDTTVELFSIPTILVGKDLEAVMSKLANPDAIGDVAYVTDDVTLLPLATIACHSAVRAGEDLGEDERSILLAEAKTVDFFHNCPHGRRVFRWYKKSQVASWFDR